MANEICSRCIMDSSDPNLKIDDFGICNHCKRYDAELEKRVVSPRHRKEALQLLIRDIKKSKKRGQKYDCVIGVSGGVDSTFVAKFLVENGLRPLAVHFDNTWNSDLAVTNVENTLRILGVDLHTHVVEWKMFGSLQKSFLLSSTPDGEIPSDHAINAVLYAEAAKRNIRYVINGMNFQTEGMSVEAWSYGHSDWRYIKDINRRFGGVSLRAYPHFSLPKLFYYLFIKGIKSVSILNYIEYNKEKVKDIIIRDLNWVDYGGKHYESIYTRWFQGHFLPHKFGIDKRRGHYSDLIRSGQMTRADALQAICKPDYPSDLKLEDEEFVLKKLQLSKEELERIYKQPRRSFRDYRNSHSWINRGKRLYNYLRLKNWVSK